MKFKSVMELRKGKKPKNGKAAALIARLRITSPLSPELHAYRRSLLNAGKEIWYHWPLPNFLD